MEKIDLRKELKHLYQPSTKDVVQVEVLRCGAVIEEVLAVCACLALS
jgi:hypothetical protein